MGQDFNPAPRGEAGMDLDFLDPPHPTPPCPHPASLCIDKGYNCKFFIPKTLLFKQIYQY